MARSVQNITYTGFNKTGYISVMNNDNGENQQWELNIEYGPDNFRRTTRLTMNNELVKSKVFAGGNYEIETDARQQQRRLHYISGGNGLCAIYVTDDASEDGKMYYILKDHLGSIYAVTDEKGEIATYNGRQQIYSFDPWGRRRNPDTWTFEGVPDEYLFDRGFTGHEHLDELGLINMNGRMYEPWLGRFLSPDNYVQMPDYSQNLNRYSYALNNPLKYTDPSGNMVNSIFGNMSSVNTHNLIIGQPTKLQQAASFLIIAVMTAGVGPAYMAAAIPQAMAAFAGGFMISSISAWISGGSFGSGINAGFMGGMNGAMAILTTAAISASFTELEDYYRQNVRAIRRMKRMNKVNMRMLQKNKGSLVTTTSLYSLEHETTGLEYVPLEDDLLDGSAGGMPTTEELEKDFAKSFEVVVIEGYVDNPDYNPVGYDQIVEDLLYSEDLTSEKHDFVLVPLEVRLSATKNGQILSNKLYYTNPYYDNGTTNAYNPGFTDPLSFSRNGITYRFVIKYQMRYYF